MLNHRKAASSFPPWAAFHAPGHLFAGIPLSPNDSSERDPQRMVQITFVQETEVTFLFHRREKPLFPPLEIPNRMFKWNRFVTNRGGGEVCVAKIVW
ncbi:hypothetical protein TNIN_328531 [Trichonephila inaurata madagascariensis]|uniref:Uncharacterized protein n=1 Tax=Trichonephila inaurata madagascariensis TaxID=2747483 RepID=A0A8X7CL31_9ARAC|nr:hypothetical protein TNIN_328531 [Trichonephila inaurata madagascariensis]